MITDEELRQRTFRCELRAAGGETSPAAHSHAPAHATATAGPLRPTLRLPRRMMPSSPHRRRHPVSEAGYESPLTACLGSALHQRARRRRLSAVVRRGPPWPDPSRSAASSPTMHRPLRTKAEV
jgi:hypothetical protein